MQAIIIDKIKKYMNYNNLCTYLYGSSAGSYLQGRDIDAIAITKDIEDIKLYNIEIPIEHRNKICNLYIVSEKIFQSDTIAFKYGGYYTTKFALSFRKLLRKGNTIDPPFDFWLNQCILYDYNNENRSRLTSEKLAKFTHFIIYKYCPTFARSLSKYLTDVGQRRFLNDYLAEKILPEYALLRTRELKDIVFQTYNNNCEKAFYLFWDEYNKQKTNRHLWNDKTFNKINISLMEINIPLIEEYFKEIREL